MKTKHRQGHDCVDSADYKCQVLVDKTVIDNQYMKYVSSIKEPDLVSEICIQIPSFCDSELLKTIDAYRQNAANPQRLHFAICFQDDDTETLQKLLEIPNCKVKHFAKAEAPGLCAARYECNKLVDDEVYVMHTDSHMRAAKYWDVVLIDMWKQCNDEKAIVSSYPIDYTPYADRPTDDVIFTEDVKDIGVSFNIVSNFNSDGQIRFRGLRVRGESKIQRGMFTSGGFLFAKAELDAICPSDPNMFFVADEVAMALRYWTYGYNVYHPTYMPIWHLYGRQSAGKNAKQVERFNTQDKDYMNKRIAEERRIRQLLDPSVRLDEFWTGDVRSVSSFIETAGIDFEHHAVRGWAKTGHYFRDLSELKESDFVWYYYEMSDKPAGEREHICRDEHCFEPSYPDHETDTICVQIPSYRDKQILRTVESLCYQADHPNRVHFAICLQDDDKSVIETLQKYENVKLDIVRPENARGTGAARLACQRLYDNEDYILITDAHMLAIRHWDTMLIDQLKRLHDDKAVISGQAPDMGILKNRDLWRGCFDMPYPMTSFGVDDFTESNCSVPSLLYNNHYNTLLYDKWKASDAFDVCVRSFGITGDYTFTRGSFNQDVPYSDQAVYRGDECMTSVIAFTKGYNVYTYRNAYLLHDSDTSRAREMTPDLRDRLRTEQLAMYDLVMKGMTSDVSIGCERSLAELSAYAGIDFKNHIIYKRAYLSEPGVNTDLTESVGCHVFRKDTDRLLNRRIHIVVAFDHKASATEEERFVQNVMATATRPGNIAVHICRMVKGVPYGKSMEQMLTLCDLEPQELLLFVDGAVRFISGWDQNFLKTFDGLNPYTVFSTQTYMYPAKDCIVDTEKQPYKNKSLKIAYNIKRSDISVTIGPDSTFGVKPVAFRGIIGMTMETYNRVPFDPNMSYDDFLQTYSLRLYTHGFDVYYDRMSYLYRIQIPKTIDGITSSSTQLKRRLLGSFLEDDTAEWKQYPYGHGTARSIGSWYRMLGYIDTNRCSHGEAEF